MIKLSISNLERPHLELYYHNTTDIFFVVIQLPCMYSADAFELLMLLIKLNTIVVTCYRRTSKSS